MKPKKKPTQEELDASNYHKNLGRKLVPVACHECREIMLPKKFEEHCKKIHGLDSKLACVWCWGKISWKYGDKKKHSKHLLKCFRKFIAPFEISANLKPIPRKSTADNPTTTQFENSTTKPQIIDVDRKLCLGHDFFDHDDRYITKKLPKSALELFALLPLEPHPVAFTDENLNLAASCLKKYLETRDTHDWFHVMVKAVAFETFVAAIEEEENATTGLLPFSCWCDGGPHEEARHRQHRHMIAVSPKDRRFKREVWSKVCMVDQEDRPCKNYLTKCLKRIVGPMHLVNTLGYLSKRKSRCQFYLEKKKKRRLPPLANKHFYIFKTLPIQFRLPLCVLWEEGLSKLMYQQHFQNVSVESVIQYPLNRAFSQWRQKIDDFYDLPRRLVLPVDPRLVPIDRETSRFVYLLNGRKLHFTTERRFLGDVSQSAENWLARQARGGNCFYDAVGGEWWIPRPCDQEKLNLVMPREYLIKELEVENGYLKNRNAELENENKQLNQKIYQLYEKENEYLKSELEKILEKCTCNSSSKTININNNNNSATENVSINMNE